VSCTYGVSDKHVRTRTGNGRKKRNQTGCRPSVWIRTGCMPGNMSRMHARKKQINAVSHTHLLAARTHARKKNQLGLQVPWSAAAGQFRVSKIHRSVANARACSCGRIFFFCEQPTAQAAAHTLALGYINKSRFHARWTDATTPPVCRCAKEKKGEAPPACSRIHGQRRAKRLRCSRMEETAEKNTRRQALLLSR
jgi:hypothetical protein